MLLRLTGSTATALRAAGFLAILGCGGCGTIDLSTPPYPQFWENIWWNTPSGRVIEGGDFDLAVASAREVLVADGRMVLVDGWADEPRAWLLVAGKQGGRNPVSKDHRIRCLVWRVGDAVKVSFSGTSRNRVGTAERLARAFMATYEEAIENRSR